MEPQAALIWADRTVELHAETPIHPGFARIILPGYAENDLTLRLDNPLEDSQFDVFRMFFQHTFQRIKHFLDRLVKLRLVRISIDYTFEKLVQKLF